MLVNKTIKSERQKSTTRIQQSIKEVQQLQVPILLTSMPNKTHELNFTIPAPSTKQAKPQYCQFATICPAQTILPTFLYSRFTTKHKTTIVINPIRNTQWKTEARISDYMKTPNHILVTEFTWLKQSWKQQETLMSRCAPKTSYTTMTVELLQFGRFHTGII